jgi:hypothetical protein
MAHPPYQPGRDPDSYLTDPATHRSLAAAPSMIIPNKPDVRPRRPLTHMATQVLDQIGDVGPYRGLCPKKEWL